MKETTKRIKNWNELIDFIESINPNRQTVVLTGWINNLYLGQTYIKELIFTTKTVELLRENKNDKPTNKLDKRTNPKSKRK